MKSEQITTEPHSSTLTLTHKNVGEYNQSTIVGKNFSVTSIKAALHDDYLIGFSAPYLTSSVNMCINLGGSLETHFNNNELTAGLEANTQHYNYVPAVDYELLVRKEMQCVHIAVDLEYYSDLLSESEKWSDDLKGKLKDKQLCFSGNMKADHGVKRILMEIQTASFTSKLRDIYLEAKILELICLQLHMQNNAEQSLPEPVMKKKEKDLFQDVRTYIDKSFTEDHSLRSISRTFGINEFKLKQGFRQAFGTSVFNYIHEKKMSYALSLIREDGKTITDVAGIIGYKNPNHFSTAFKKKFGITPSTLR